MQAEKSNNERMYLRPRGQGKKNNYKCRKTFFWHYGWKKKDEVYSGGLQRVSGFMSVTLDQWPELMRCYMLPGTRAGKLLFWCTLESREFQKSSIWWKTEQPSVAQWSLTSGIYWNTIPCWEKVSPLMRAVFSNFTNFLPSGSNASQKEELPMPFLLGNVMDIKWWHIDVVTEVCALQWSGLRPRSVSCRNSWRIDMVFPEETFTQFLVQTMKVRSHVVENC